jgi:hypothetical protein
VIVHFAEPCQVEMSQKDRKDRLLQTKPSGWTGTVSSDFFHLVHKLTERSKAEAERLDGNTSSYVWAALPILLSGLSATLVEQEAIYLNQRKPDRVQMLADVNYLPEQFVQLYGLKGDLLDDLKVLVELRNEIIHPAHMPTGTPDNWPDTLRSFKAKGLLSSTGDPQSDYLMLGQMKSLRLLLWAVDVVNRLRNVVLTHHGKQAI